MEPQENKEKVETHAIARRPNRNNRPIYTEEGKSCGAREQRKAAPGSDEKWRLPCCESQTTYHHVSNGLCLFQTLNESTIPKRTAERELPSYICRLEHPQNINVNPINIFGMSNVNSCECVQSDSF